MAQTQTKPSTTSGKSKAEAFRLPLSVAMGLEKHRFYRGEPWEETDTELLVRMLERLEEAIAIGVVPTPPTGDDLVEAIWGDQGSGDEVKVFSFRAKARHQDFIKAMRRRLTGAVRSLDVEDERKAVAKSKTALFGYIYAWALRLPKVKAIASPNALVGLLKQKFGEDKEIPIADILQQTKNRITTAAFKSWLEDLGEVVYPSRIQRFSKRVKLYQMMPSQAYFLEANNHVLPFGKKIAGVQIRSIEVMSSAGSKVMELNTTDVWRKLHSKSFGEQKCERRAWIRYKARPYSGRKVAELIMIKPKDIPEDSPGVYTPEKDLNTWRKTFMGLWNNLLEGKIGAIAIKGCNAYWLIKRLD